MATASTQDTTPQPGAAINGPWSHVLTKTYLDHFEALVRLARRHCPSTELPEDVVQDVFIRFHERACAPAPDKQLSYLRSMVINHARTAARVQHRHDRAIAGFAAVAAPVTVDLDARMASEALAASVRRLPDRQQRTVRLRYIAGLSERETAGVLGIGTGSVKQHASRARCTLRAELEAAS